MFVYEKRLEYPINIKTPILSWPPPSSASMGGRTAARYENEAPGVSPGPPLLFVYCSFLFRRFITIKPAIPDRDSAHSPARIMR